MAQYGAVTTAIRRTAALLAVASTLLAGCGSGPTQANSAIIIGDRVVSVDDIQQRLDSVLKKEPAAKELAQNHKLDLVSRGIVNQLVRHELIAEAARRESLTVTDQEITDLVNGSAPAQDPVQRSVDAAFDPAELARDRLLTVRLGRKSLDQIDLQLDGAALQGPDGTKENAVKLAREIAAEPARAAELGTAAVGGDPQASIKGLSWNAISVYARAAQNSQGQQPPPDAMIPPLFAAPPGSAIAFSLGSGEQGNAGWLVVLVRRSDAGVPAEMAQFAAEIPESWQYTLGDRLLGPLASELGLRISPRYGVWDELAVAVAATEGEKTGEVFPAAVAKQ